MSLRQCLLGLLELSWTMGSQKFDFVDG